MNPGHMTLGEEKPRQRPFPSVRTKLTVYFSLMAVAILAAIQLTNIVGVPFTAYSGMQGQQRAEAFKSLELVADLNKERLLRLIKQQRDDIRVAANNRFTAAAVVRLRATIRELSARGRGGTELWDLVRETQDYRGLLKHLNDFRYGINHKLAIVDAGTGKVFISTDEALQGADFSEHDGFTGAFGSADAYVGDIRTGALDPAPSLCFSHAIRDGAGKVVAVLWTAVSANDIIKPLLYTGTGLGERGEVLLINRDAENLLPLKHPLADGTVAKPLGYRIQAQPALLAATGHEGIIETEDYRGEPTLAAYRYIPVTSEWGWGMVIKRDREELFAPLRRGMTYSSAIGLVGLLTLIALIAWLARSLTRPILALSQTAVRVAEGDLDARAPVTTSDEVGYLARTFNLMLQRTKERTEELAALNKELEAFSYSVSHDLRSPLRAIDGFSSILLEDYSGTLDAKGKRLLNIIRTNTQKMGQLIDDLLAFARLGRQHMKLTVINMAELTKAVFDELASRSPERKLELHVKTLPPAQGDPAMIRQVFVNLLSNAIKFTRYRDPTVIEVGHRVDDRSSVYYVKDNGAGFDMQYVHKLFGVFQRLHTSEQFEGTGVGLAIVQQIIQRHGGRVWAEGKVNEGATISFTLAR